MTPYEQALAALAKQVDRVIEPEDSLFLCSECGVATDEEDIVWQRGVPVCADCRHQDAPDPRDWDDHEHDLRREEA
jgi:hypothetical protein